MCLYRNNFIIQTSSVMDWVCVCVCDMKMWSYFMNEYLCLLTKMFLGHWWRYGAIFIVAENTFWSLFNTTSEEQQHVWDFVRLPRPEICTSLALFWLVDEIIIIQRAPLCVRDLNMAMTWEEKIKIRPVLGEMDLIFMGASVSKHKRSRVQTESAAASVVGVSLTPPSALRLVPRHKRVSSNIPQTGTKLFFFLFYCCILLHMLCVRLCVEGQRGHSCWRGANVMRMFTRLQVTVPLTLLGRSSTLAQSLHLVPNTCEHWTTREHAHSLFSLSLSSLTWSFRRTGKRVEFRWWREAAS